MSREFQVTFDAADPIELSLFWAEVLDYVVQPPPGSDLPPETPAADVLAAWAAFLTATGVPAERHRSASAIIDPAGARPRVFFQQVPEPKSAKNRVHLDVRAAPGLEGDERMAALETECERLVSLGASRIRRFEPDPPMSSGFIVMADPGGNEFCLD
ncbi:VOC family protein [Intrasporangium sp. DVR]|uniref:VOC family protein n=1 Tax=Intrasporangium sp. DVR TaxID=3127867 RepID=UPI00313A4E45